MGSARRRTERASARLRRAASLCVAAGLCLTGPGCGHVAAPVPASANVESSSPPAYVATFRLQDAGDDAEGVPHTRVDFVMHSPGAPSRVEALGREAGGCVERPAREGELLRVGCWWGPSECQWVARRDATGLLLLRAEGPREALPAATDDSATWEARVHIALPAGTVVTRLGD